MNLKYLIAGSLCLLSSAYVLGVPARPGYHTLPGPDGKMIEVEAKGDEYFHYFVDDRGQHYTRIGNKTLKPISLEDLDIQLENAANLRKAPATINKTFPTTGTVRGLVILAEFPECKFQESSTKEYFHNKINQTGYKGDETYGSVIDYFTEQSQGRFTPVFDVVGPVTMPHPASYYVNNTMDLSNFFRDLCTLADKECDVDFSKYDIDNDGFVDFVFSIFAGYSQAQSLNPDDIWPAMQYLSNFVYEIFDDKYLNVAACASELKGKDGVEKDGIGTICHEFSHILGLPDIYDTRGGSGYGMGHFDSMDVGTYNNDGITPSGFTAMDRYTLGWLDPIELTGSGTDFELKPFIESNEAVVIVNPENNAEFITLENRQLQGFDSGLPGHGLIVSQIHYDPKVWKGNTVNAPMISGYEHVRLLAADKNWLKTSEASDPFPGEAGITQFGTSKTYEIKWHTTTNSFHIPVRNIRETADGIIMFDYGTDTGVNEVVENAPCMEELINSGAKVFSISGIEQRPDALSSGIYIVRKDGQSYKFRTR